MGMKLIINLARFNKKRRFHWDSMEAPLLHTLIICLLFTNVICGFQQKITIIFVIYYKNGEVVIYFIVKHGIIYKER